MSTMPRGMAGIKVTIDVKNRRGIYIRFAQVETEAKKKGM